MWEFTLPPVAGQLDSYSVGLGAVALFLAAVGSAGILYRRRSVAGTTLVGAWWWSLISLWAICLTEVALAWLGPADDASWPQAWRFAAAATTFCPIMAALGAKRPQHQAWHLIVCSLWAILVLPAAESIFLRTGEPFEIHGARSWFLAALVIVGVANSLPTRFWFSALLVGGGQAVMFLQYLPLGVDGLGAPGTLWGLGLCVGGMLMLSCGYSPRQSSRAPLDRVWLDFRDLFGAVWGLRVAERVNASAALYQWNIALSWNGFRAADGSPMLPELTSDQTAAVRQNLDNLLRRFVSEEWIDARLGGNEEAR